MCEVMDCDAVSRAFFRRSAFLLVFVLLAALGQATTEEASPAAEIALPPEYRSARVENTHTSIYIGRVSLSLTPFERQADAYHSTYSTRVFPYFVYNEKGRLWIRISDDDLRRLIRGETIHFSGQAESTGGEPRRIEGRAVPASATEGKLKVRVFVTPKIELIFNTTYRFPAEKTEKRNR